LQTIEKGGTLVLTLKAQNGETCLWNWPGI
jgi:uncharacterized protein YegP (UPF0339 family)